MVSTTAPLEGLRIVEAGSFVAVPSGGMTLAQLGAEVIRVDPPVGNSDFRRWPLAPNGKSLFWAGLNKGKRSVTIDHRRDEGRELLVALATAPGSGSGIFVDNMAGRGRLRYAELQARRADVIHVHFQGRSNGAPAVDYTVNAEIGLPDMTGPTDGAPVNHVLPAWDLVAGMTATTSLLAAVVNRDRTGRGAQVDLALADVALAAVGGMGWLAEAEIAGRARSRHGNHMFGAFGVDFETADGHRVMVVALTGGQWRALREATTTGAVFAAIEEALSVDLEADGDRYRLRETIAAVLRPWFGRRDLDTVGSALDRGRVLWSTYKDMATVAAEVRDTPAGIAADMDQPGLGMVLATGSPVRWDGVMAAPVPAPRLGGDTDAVLAELLGLSDAELGRLRRSGVTGPGGSVAMKAKP